MRQTPTRLSNPFSTGSGGPHFEAHIQASFVVLMLTGGYAPCMPCWPITEIKLQGKIDGYDTDDLIVFVQRPSGSERRKFVAQVKHSVKVTEKDATFSRVIHDAWRDFNNEKLFDRERDVLALITGPLSATDHRNVSWLLDQARHTKDPEEFRRHVEQSHFSPPRAVEKLRVIQHHLQAANGGVALSAEDVYAFLNRFRLLGYDLGTDMGVVLSLLHSHIRQFNQQYPEWAWSRIVDTVQIWNQDAGTIIVEKLPDDVREAFNPITVLQFPSELASTNSLEVEQTWGAHPQAGELMVAVLVGSWNEKKPSDQSAVALMAAREYTDFVPKLQELLQLPNSPVSLRDGVWDVSDRASLWEDVGPRVFDRHLESYRQLVSRVLGERNPAFDLAPDERYAAATHKKILTHSGALRRALAQGLALMGARPNALTNCSSNLAELTAALAVRSLLDGADWTLWGSLNNLLPSLAEAAPEEFLDGVEKALQLNPCPFDDLFAQEGNGVTGSNYLTGLLWALEVLAWDENLLVRSCVVLADLAARDPGGNWSNRPSNSLKTILLPWKPQTLATVERRKVAVGVVCNEQPQIGWALLLALLPDQHQMTTGSHKPKWRWPAASTEVVVTQQDYRLQVQAYATLTMQLAGRDEQRLGDLIGRISTFPKQTSELLLNSLEQYGPSFDADVRLSLWERLTKLERRHKRFPSASWAMSADLLSRVESVRQKLAPGDPVYESRELFTDNDHDLFQETGNWEEQRKALDARRKQAVQELLRIGGATAVVEFAETVKSRRQVGQAWGAIADEATDALLLPAGLHSENRKLGELTDSYVWVRRYIGGWAWADALDISSWSAGDIGQFLAFLPFVHEAWKRAEEWLGEAQGEYWSRVHANPYQQDEDFNVAARMLLRYGRPQSAIDCLARMVEMKKPIDSKVAIDALMAAVSTRESEGTMDGYRIIELIKSLQADPQVSEEDLFGVEWAYVRLLDRHDGGAPVLLHRRLKSDPDFFCELIRLQYRSKDEVGDLDKAEDADASDDEESPHNDTQPHSQAIAENAWRLLHDWDSVPGANEDGTFNSQHFTQWVARMKASSAASGHLEVALLTFGAVLIHAPPDGDGLWINRAVADALNARDAEDMRNGYRSGAYNSRGAFWVDPEGKPERELAAQYRRKADYAENASYQRLAATLRSLAESYEREARSRSSGGSNR